MRVFDPSGPGRSQRHAEVYAAYELAYTTVDLVAAVTFIVGSIMFFFEDWMNTGTWFFLVGSVCFAVKPSLRFAREITLLRMGKTDTLAERFDGG